MVAEVTKPVGVLIRAVDDAKSSAFRGGSETFCGGSADEIVGEWRLGGKTRLAAVVTKHILWIKIAKNRLVFQANSRYLSAEMRVSKEG